MGATMKPLFTDASQITPSVITNVLRAGNVIDQSFVVSLEIDPIVGGASFNAQLFRLQVTYDQPQPTYPASLIAKLPTGNVELHENAAIFQFDLSSAVSRCCRTSIYSYL